MSWHCCPHELSFRGLSLEATCPKTSPTATVPCCPAAPCPCLGQQVTKTGTHPPRSPLSSHHQPCSQPGCEWKSTWGGRRAAPLRGSRLPQHRILAASQELFFHAWLPRALLKGRLVWPCLLSGCRLQPTALPPHTTPSKHPHRGGKDQAGHCAWATSYLHGLWLAWHCTGTEPTSHCAATPATPHTGTIPYIRQRDERIFIMSTGTVGASLLVSCSPTRGALQSTAPTEFPFNSCQVWSQPMFFCLGDNNPG